MEDKILVSTQDLMNASGDFQNGNSTIKELTGQMLTLARGLNKQWEGSSAESYIAKFNELEDDIQMIDKLIAAYVKKLQDVALVYEKGDQNVETFTQGINTTLIS